MNVSVKSKSNVNSLKQAIRYQISLRKDPITIRSPGGIYGEEGIVDKIITI